MLELLLFIGDQPGDAVKRHAAVIANNPAATVGVGQAGDNPDRAAQAHLGRVGVKNPLVVSFTVLKNRSGLSVDRAAGRLDGRGGHAETAEGHKRAFERGVGLQAHDHFVGAVDVTGRVRADARNHRRVQIEHTAGGSVLAGQQLADFAPERQGAGGGLVEESLLTGVGPVVALDEVAYVDALGPETGFKGAPGRLGWCD